MRIDLSKLTAADRLRVSSGWPADAPSLPRQIAPLTPAEARAELARLAAAEQAHGDTTSRFDTCPCVDCRNRRAAQLAAETVVLDHPILTVLPGVPAGLTDAEAETRHRMVLREETDRSHLALAVDDLIYAAAGARAELGNSDARCLDSLVCAADAVENALAILRDLARYATPIRDEDGQ